MSEQPTRSMTQQQVNDKAKVQRLSMTEADFVSINPKGHKRTYRPDGGYEWTNTYAPNDGHGKLTKVAQAVTGGMQRFADADTARCNEIQSRIERTPMRDADGNTHFIEPGRADDCAQRNGWGHSWRAGGLITKAGPEGMLFRLVRDAWECTGRWCTGEPHAFSKCPPRGRSDGTMYLIGLYADPDGYRWRFIGEWVRV